jgi:hypothetical protein
MTTIDGYKFTTIDGCKFVIITTYKNTKQTHNWNLGMSIGEIKLKKKLHFKRATTWPNALFNE